MTNELVAIKIDLEKKNGKGFCFKKIKCYLKLIMVKLQFFVFGALYYCHDNSGCEPSVCQCTIIMDLPAELMTIYFSGNHQFSNGKSGECFCHQGKHFKIISQKFLASHKSI